MKPTLIVVISACLLATLLHSSNALGNPFRVVREKRFWDLSMRKVYDICDLNGDGQIDDDEELCVSKTSSILFG